MAHLKGFVMRKSNLTMIFIQKQAKVQKLQSKLKDLEARKSIRVINMAFFTSVKKKLVFKIWQFYEISVFDKTVLLEPLSHRILAASSSPI